MKQPICQVYTRGLPRPRKLPKRWYNLLFCSVGPTTTFCIFCGRVFDKGEHYMMVDGRDLGVCTDTCMSKYKRVFGKLGEAGKDVDPYPVNS